MSATIDLQLNSTQRRIGTLGDFIWERENEAPLSLELNAFNLIVDTNGSVHGLSGWSEMVRLHPQNPQLTADPLPHLNHRFAKGAHIAVLCVLATGTAVGANWGTIQPPPATFVGWDPLVQSLKSHPTMSSPEVAEFLELRPNADIDALRKHFDLLQSKFGDVGGRSWRYWYHIDHDDGQPYLFLTMQLPDDAMDLDELLRREQERLEIVIATPTLQAASEYHIVSAA